MKKAAAFLIIFCISSLSFGIGSFCADIRPAPQLPEIRININGLDDNIVKHSKILDSIVNFNKAKIISKNIQIDSLNIITNYSTSFTFYFILKNNQENMIEFIRTNFKGLQLGYNKSSNGSELVDSVGVMYYVSLVSKEHNKNKKDQYFKNMREQQYPTLILIVIISIAVLLVVTISLILIKIILRK